MANTPAEFRQVFLTYLDIKQANPGWSDRMVEDYLALKADLLLTAESGDSTNVNLNDEIGTDSLAIALIADIRQQIGSGDPLTWDETGFTWDLDTLSFDQTEA